MNSTMKALVIGVFALLVSISMFAQTPEVSKLAVTEPLDVGGTILEPGTYLIRVLPSNADRDKVQITSEDRKTIYVTALTVPHALAPREEVNTTFVYYPAGEGMPRALRTWFAKSPTVTEGGHDIVYPEARAQQLARMAASRVISYRADTAVADLDKTELLVVTPEAKVETYTPAPMMSQSSPEMPNTASTTPLIALLGLVSLGGAFAIRMARL